MDTWLRIINIVLAVAAAVLFMVWLSYLMKQGRLTSGQFLSRSGAAVVCLGVAYGTSEVLFHYPFSIRLPLIFVGLLWLTIGLCLQLRDDVRSRR